MAKRGIAHRAGGTQALDAAQQRHEELMRLYRESKHSNDSNGATAQDFDVLKRNFQFIRDEEADIERGESDWEVRLSVRYYRKLFREYALADLSRYHEGKVGLRWRTAMEVVAGKGQFVCGNKQCGERDDLHSYELLFAYVEQGEKKRCLVKVRVCEDCARKLFYRKLKEKEKDRKRGRERSEDSSDDEKEQRRRKRSSGGRDPAEKTEREEPSIHDVCSELNEADARDLAVDRPTTRRSDEDKEIQSLLL